MTKQLLVDLRGHVRVPSIVRVALVTVLLITKQLVLVEILASHELKALDDVLNWVKAGTSGDVRDKDREHLVDDMLVHLDEAIEVKRRRDHDVDLGFGVQLDETLDQVFVVVHVVVLVPLVVLRVVGAEHDDDDVRVGSQGIFVSLLVPVWEVTLPQGGSTTNSEVLDDGSVLEHGLELCWVGLSIHVGRAKTLSDRVSDSRNSDLGVKDLLFVSKEGGGLRDE